MRSKAPVVQRRVALDPAQLALAISARSYLVTGDQHLLGLEADLPIPTPAGFLAKLRQGD